MMNLGSTFLGFAMALSLPSTAVFASNAPAPAHPTQTTQYIQCESSGNHYQECYVNGGHIVHVYLDHQLSSVPCQEGNTWGWNQNGIWVNYGCRGVFAVEISWAGPGPGPGNNYSFEDIHCKSSGYKYHECQTHLYSIYDIQVIQQQSGASCYPNQSFGWNSNRVWVDHGCEAVFRIYGYY